jgi:hypothetical protein
VTPLGPGEIRARRRPFVVIALASIRLLLGFLLAWPLASALEASNVGLRAGGDRALFEGGGYLLLEALRVQGPSLTAAIQGVVPLFALGLLVGAASNAALLVALNAREPLAISAWLGRALARLPAVVVLGVGTTLAQGLLLVVGFLAVQGVPERLARPVPVTFAQGALWLVVLLLAASLGGFADVARSALVRHEEPLLQSLERALRCLKKRPFRSCFGWLAPAALLAVTALGAAWLTERCDVSREGAWRVGAVLALHQAVVLVAVAARANWYARALRLVATS